MKKIVLLTMLALSFLAAAAMADNPIPICDASGSCNWVR
jgi:hypothetical protein